MSVLTVAIVDNGIIAACDGVCYTYETGEVSGFVSKMILLPEYSALIGWTGAGGFGTALRWEIGQQIGSFDELVEEFQELCETAHWKLFGWDRGPVSEVSCVIAGWSIARQAYEAYRLVSYDKPSVDLSDGTSITLEPFTPTPLPGGLWCSYSPKKLDEFGLNPVPEGADMLNIATRLVCAARADSGWIEGKPGDDDRYFMAGGFVQIAVLQMDSAQSWIAHRWPEDVIGEPIDPARGEPMPSFLVVQ